MAPALRHRPPVHGRQAGFALVGVLWAAVILAVIAGSVLATARTDARLVHTHYQIAQLESAADAAINIAILRMLDPDASARPPMDATPFTVAFGERRIGVRAQDEAGKIDLNLAKGDLLRALLVVAGMAGDDAERLVDRMLDWREPGGAKRPDGATANEHRGGAGLAHAPRGGPFESIEELQLLVGVTPALFARIAPSLTVHSATPWVDPGFASADVLAALAALGDRSAPEAAAARSAGAAGTVMLGHAFTIVAEAGDADRLRAVRTAVIRLTGHPRQPVLVYRWS